MTLKRKIILRSDTLASWTAANPILSQNEVAVESDTGMFKFGNGLNGYSDIPYFNPLLPVPLASYTVLTVPSAATYIRSQIYISDEAGGAVIAFSDGTNWRRVTDRAIIS
ncbi:MAG: hypothetical protein MIO92_02930 [Methanosarcinaceae archaeon]|nr:hypothetical protein [Methanosarcinaceae archaeon]